MEEVGLTEDQLKFEKELGSYERYPGGITKDTPSAYPMEIYMFLFSTEYTGELIPTDENVKETKWVDINKVTNILTDNSDIEKTGRNRYQTLDKYFSISEIILSEH